MTHRKTRPAGALRVGDFIHDPLAPMRVTGFEAAAAGVVRVVGRMESGTTLRVQHPADRPLDVTRRTRGGHLRLICTRGG